MNLVTRSAAWLRAEGGAAPVWGTFAASLILSLIALAPGGLNRDGMLYSEAARAFVEGGLPAAKAVFSWPFLAVLMGGLSRLTGLAPETAGHVLNALFLGGACALMVDMVRRQEPRLAWLAGLVILALPGLNDYRNELIREYGCWFFTLVAFRLALEWPARPGWGLALGIQAAIALAALFRPEAAVFYAAVLGWQHFQASPASRLRRWTVLGSLPALALAALLIAHFSGALPGNSRLAGEISRFDFSGFDATAKAMGQAFNPYARDSAQTAHAILFFGSLALIPWKLLWKFGPFLLPLLFFARSPARPVATARYSLLAVAFVCHTLVLAVFVLRMQFVSGRYLGPLLLFATPFVALGLMSLLDRLPRWRWGVIALCVVLALANVTSLGGAKKRQFRDAGQWLAAQAKVEDPSIFLASARTAHYAGWRFSTRAGKELDRDKLSAEVAAGRYRLVILEVSRKDPDFGDWLTRSGLREVRRFPGDSGEAVVVAEPLRDGASPSQGSRAQP